ncbi:MAG: DVU_1557 family redox protein [Bifidobacterium adolescentis]
MNQEASWVAHPEWLCGKCNIPLQVQQVNVEYMDNAFPANLLRCPQCGNVFIPEDLAMGKMNEVEKSLEDK